MDITTIAILTIVLLPLVLILLALHLRLSLLNYLLKNTKKEVSKYLATKKMLDTVVDIFTKVAHKNDLADKLVAEIKTEKENMFEEQKGEIFDLQERILEIERKSAFEPKSWWPKKYVQKLETIKLEARELLKKIREL